MVSSVWPVLSLDGVLVLGVLVRLATILYLFLFSPVCGTGVGFSISARDNSNFSPLPPVSSESSLNSSPRSSSNTGSKVSGPVSAPVSGSGNNPKEQDSVSHISSELNSGKKTLSLAPKSSIKSPIFSDLRHASPSSNGTNFHPKL